MRRIALVRSAVSTVALSVATFVAAAPAIGDLPPPDLGTDSSGAPVVLADYAGKAVVISFWATWCEYCLKELPILEGIQNAAGKERMQVIAVNTESRDVFRRAAKAMSGLSLLVSSDPGHQAFRAYGVHGIPHMVIVGRDGRIVHVYHGYAEGRLNEIVADINRAIAPP